MSFAGIVDAVYLTTKHYSGETVICSVFNGCELATTSIYSMIFGIPVALLGVIYYSIVFILAFLFLKFAGRGILFTLFAITAIGFLASLWFTYAQVFIIDALCLYCIISAGISTILFILSTIMMIQYKKYETTS